MRAFSQATRADFEELDSILADGNLHVYNNRELPEGCNPDRVRIGFEKDGDIYTLYIDRGIETSIRDCDFALWIDKGETRFVGLDDLIIFFRSVAPLFKTAEQDDGNTEMVCIENTAVEVRINHGCESADLADGSAIVDRQKLRTINEGRKQNKEVWPEEIAEQLKNQIFGQDKAIDALAEGIAINQMKSEDKVYVAMFLGPPASGKTETGTILAKVLSGLYEREYGFIKIDANTYKREHMIQNILGAPPSYVGYGKATVMDPIRKNPYHVVLIDEVEKAHEDLLVALMEALDTGYLSMADNSPDIDLNKCIILFTSNIPVDMAAYSSVSEYDRNELCKDIFTKHCGRPEISRRIKDFMVFVPISEDAEVDIIIKFARRTLADYGAVLVHIDEHLMADFLKSKTKYGASEISNRVAKAIGRAMIKSHNRYLINGRKVSVKGTPENIEFEVIEGGERE